jgi:hypothetical protein
MNPHSRSEMKQLLSTLTLVLLLIVGSAESSQSATLYCGPTGNDARTLKQAKSRRTPLKTIERALQLVSDGDTIVALDGSYSFSGCQLPTYKRYGSTSFDRLPDVLASNVVLRSEKKWGATLSGEIELAGLNGFRLDGFRIISGSTSGGDAEAGVSFVGCVNPFIKDCFIESEVIQGIGFLDCDWAQAEWNIITFRETRSSSSPGTGIVVAQPRYQVGPDRPWGHWIRNNTVFGTGRGIWVYIDDGSRGFPTTNYDRPSLIENNIIFDLVDSKRPSSSSAAFQIVGFRNVRVRNNTLVRDVDFLTTPLVSIRQSDRVYLYNNIISATNQTPTFELTDNKETLVFNNVVEGANVPADVASMNYIGSPLFDPDSFVPSATSPALDGGFDAGDHFFLDVTGAPRLNGPLDIGAIER